MVKRKTEFSRMWLVDSNMMNNLNTSSSQSKVNNHVNFSLTKPSNEIQYKTIERILWREEQERLFTLTSYLISTHIDAYSPNYQ